MTSNTGQRGRPKGSGIDDSQWIGAIANMIAENPDLKPTTAIKALGIENPSVIRRLRDKYRAQEGDGGDDDAECDAAAVPSHRHARQAEATMALAGPKDAVRKASAAAPKIGTAGTGTARRVVKARRARSTANTATPIQEQRRNAARSPEGRADHACAQPLVGLFAAGATLANFAIAQQALNAKICLAHPAFRFWAQQQVLFSALVLETSGLAPASRRGPTR